MPIVMLIAMHNIMFFVLYDVIIIALDIMIYSSLHIMSFIVMHIVFYIVLHIEMHFAMVFILVFPGKWKTPARYGGGALLLSRVSVEGVPRLRCAG